MPLEYHVDHESKTVFINISGEVAASTMETVRARLWSPDLVGMNRLFDITEQIEPLTSDEIQEMAKMARAAPAVRGARWAFVVKRPAQFGMIRMLAAYMEPIGVQVEVFKSIDEAKQWVSSATDTAQFGTDPAPSKFSLDPISEVETHQKKDSHPRVS